jgi:hypothetical protein
MRAGVSLERHCVWKALCNTRKAGKLVREGRRAVSGVWWRSTDSDKGLMAVFRDVDPRELRVPPSRRQGADPVKLARQIALFGRSAVGMPPLWVYEGTDGVLVLYNGVTRATRIAKLAPGTLIRVEVIGTLPKAFAGEPRIGDLLP